MASAIPRIKTGIPGLDPLIQGGFVKNSINLVAGGAGTGKTIFASQFLWEGLKNGEPGVYLTMEQHPDDLMGDVIQFGCDFAKYVKQGTCSVVYFDPAQINNIASAAINHINTMKARRLVVDSTSVIGLTIESPMMLRRKLLNLVDAVKRDGKCTVLMTTEVAEDGKGYTRYGVEEFVADSLIQLKMVTMGKEAERTLEVRKMRRTGHKTGFNSMEITDKGIKVTA